MNLEYTPNDLAQDVRITAIQLLNQQLADVLDLGLQVKQAHWNVKGPQFISLHEFFDDVAETIEGLADVMAERAVQLGGFAEGTVQAIMLNSRLPAYALDLYRGSDHLRGLSSALNRFAASTRAAIATATKAGDADTADVFTHVSRGADSLLWKVSAHIPEAWELPLSTAKPAGPKTTARPRDSRRGKRN